MSSPPSVMKLPAGTDQLFKDRSESLWLVAVKRLFRQRSGVTGMVILGFLVLVAIFAPVIAPFDPNDSLIGKEDIRKRTAPCIHLLGCSTDQPQHLMGVDGNVRDVFSRIVFGARISLFVGFVTIGSAIVVGTMLGSIAGYVGGWIDDVIMRIMDVLLAFPFLLLTIAITSALRTLFDNNDALEDAFRNSVPQFVFEQRGLIYAMFAIAIVSIPAYARVIRSTVLSVKEEEYVAAARSIGNKPGRILLLHVLPNAFPPLIVVATLGIGTAILETAALSFLGLGAQPPTPEWGAMLASERNQLFSAPHLVLFPGIAIMTTVLGFNLLGDGLRDALDPRLRL
jgi:ABC-type dipeptide/oligopeptide/nickel transport system permease subunit